MILTTKLRIISVGFIVFSTLAYAENNYPNTESMGGQADKNSDWYKQCIKVKDIRPPNSDVPSSQITSSLSGCDATNLYYTAKSKSHPDKADWQKTKNCAFASNDDAVLMMLYANGFGVYKNLNLAIQYACKVGGAPAEVVSRIYHLASMTDDDKKRVFDLCDDITSGYMQGMCASITEIQNEKARTARLVEFTNKLTKPQKKMFDKLQSSIKEFVALRGPEETDQMGTGRAAFVTETIAEEMDYFVSEIEEYEKGDVPRFNNEQFADFDKELNQIYQEIMHAKTGKTDPSRLGYSTITKESVKNTQRAWLKYRDAWVAFGRIKWTSVSPQAWQAQFTERRIDELKVILDYANE